MSLLNYIDQFLTNFVGQYNPFKNYELIINVDKWLCLDSKLDQRKIKDGTDNIKALQVIFILCNFDDIENSRQNACHKNQSAQRDQSFL